MKFKVLPFMVKIQGLDLIGRAWQWPCVRHCFESGDYLQGENPRSSIERRRLLCTVFFLKALLLEKLDIHFCIADGCAAAGKTGTL